MFYLMIMEPAMMLSVSNNWEKVLKDAREETLSILGRSSVSNEKGASREILSAIFERAGVELWSFTEGEDIVSAILRSGEELGRPFTTVDGSFSWGMLRADWVKLMCYAAHRCRPSAHSQQPSKGGELFTFIWLCMANLTISDNLTISENLASDSDSDPF
ncbi:hypothetical protein SLA2020_081430 [Shorea laevis]